MLTPARSGWASDRRAAVSCNHLHEVGIQQILGALYVALGHLQSMSPMLAAGFGGSACTAGMGCMPMTGSCALHGRQCCKSSHMPLLLRRETAHAALLVEHGG